ncbi:efflux transporter periplasmic adaptor subunit [Novosphingobium sp. PC22D]|uniref:efflux RND transporter periplasmic adaptor subunit n=1 Tax=Novosphingobium sp. PC22D TaxID=1962403 RepID=UPI000BF0E9E6|nr:efflux RND transporter periplasmic adaptor subunit [Novosphingobium sp. PC22D]PEQ13781.1 efflux transporter periplasmic adaptor subunit [Novosphingobium sp. PC22D]
MSRRAGFILLGLLALLGAAAWWLLWSRPASVEMQAVERGPATALVYATGFVEAEHPVTVSSRLTAPVVEVLVREGERVARSQPLVRLDGSEQEAMLRQAEADARGKALAEKRVTTLYGQGWVTRAARDEAVAAGDASRANAAALAARLDQMTVRAGISGIVLTRDVEPGDLATPGKALMQLGDPAQARVTATVDERDIARVRVGQQALMSSDALPGKVVRGTVTEITPGGDPDQRSFRVRIGLARAADLPFGLTLEVNIVTARHENALLVPASAVTDGRVWVVEQGRAKGREVRTGIAGTDQVEILAGLAADESVIVNPPEGLEDGDRVRR